MTAHTHILQYFVASDRCFKNNGIIYLVHIKIKTYSSMYFKFCCTVYFQEFFITRECSMAQLIGIMRITLQIFLIIKIPCRLIKFMTLLKVLKNVYVLQSSFR